MYLEKQISEYKVKHTTYCPTNYVVAEDKDGNTYLVQKNENDEVYILVDSIDGEYLTEDDIDQNGMLYMDNKNNIYTMYYAENNMAQCTECFRWFKTGVWTEDSNEFYCIDCARENLYRCDSCGSWFNDEDSVEIGEYVNGQDATVCNSCFHCSYYRCSECQTILCEDEVYEDEDGNYICESCHNELEKKRVLHRYHFAGDETSYGMRWLTIAERLQKPLLGVELEMDDGGQDEYTIEQLLIAIGGPDYAVCCCDGSLDDGFEMISCPANLENHKKTLHWANMMNLALRKGYRSHQPGTCGLHVHIDRGYFENGILSINEIEAVMYIILKNNIEWIKTFSRRASDGYGYCRINGDDDGVVIKDYDTYDKSWKKVNRFNRYQALNFSRSDTIEFRIFRGTLKERTFFATLEFVDMFARLAKQCETIDSSYDIDFDKFAALADELGYTNFIEYCNEREIA